MARKSFDPFSNLLEFSSKPLIKAIALTPLTSVQITLLGFFGFILPAAYLFSTGGYWQSLLAILLAVVSSWLDFADGAIARMKNACSPLGAWIDPAIDLIAQAIILFGVILGAFFSTANEIWLIVGLFALLGQLSENFIGIEFVHKFGFDSYVGLPLFKEQFDKAKNKHFLDFFLAQLIMPTNFVTMFFFTTRYFILVGAVLHALWLTVLCLAVLLNFRWIVTFIIYSLYLRPQKSKFAVIEALKMVTKLRKGGER